MTAALTKATFPHNDATLVDNTVLDNQALDNEVLSNKAQENKAPSVKRVAQARQPEPIQYSVSSGLAKRLAMLNVSFAFTSYQSNVLYLVGRNGKAGINIHQSAMAKPMGLCQDGDGGLILSGGYQIMRLQNVLEADQRINNQFDACYVPRTVHTTGRLDAHDVGVDKDGRALFVNTRYNCVATVSDRHSFEPVWQPPFINSIVDEDRCHLNGMAMENGRARYVTAVSSSNTIDGWRDRRGDGGIVMDLQTNQIICRGLSMPHSPRVHNGELWLLNSGTGELGVVKRDNKRQGKESEGVFEARAFCPGFVRGLAFVGDYAFVGLSKPRYKRFEGLALDQKLKDVDSEAWCGIQIIQLSTGTCVDWLRIDGNLAELYDLEILPNIKAPMAVAPDSKEAAQLVTLAASKSQTKQQPLQQEMLVAQAY